MVASSLEAVMANRIAVYVFSLGCGRVMPLAGADVAGYDIPFAFCNLLLLFFFFLPGAHFGAVFISLRAAAVDGYRHPIGHSSVRIGKSGRMQEKSVINRREWLLGVGVVAGAAAQSADGLAWSEGEAHKTRKCALDLSGFEPNSMLQVHESLRRTRQISGDGLSHPDYGGSEVKKWD
jgi:hypothetical protein